MISYNFCNQSRKMQGKSALPLIQSARDLLIQKFSANATALNDSETKITSIEESSEFFYSNTCKLMYFKRNTKALELKLSDFLN